MIVRSPRSTLFPYTTLFRSMVETALTQDELVRLFSVLSHDLKSPIFAVDGFSELLLSDYSDRVDEEGQDFLRRIRGGRSEEHTSELQSRQYLVCRLLLEKKK